MYYAQSWALTEMLVFSPGYSSRFADLIKELSIGEASPQVFLNVYGKPLDAITADLRAWVDNRKAMPITLPGVNVETSGINAAILSPFSSRLLLADLSMAAGELDRAEELYRNLDRESPGNPNISIALGTIALRKGDRAGARNEWKHAIAEGAADASLCYRYASLADDAGLPASEIRAALQRAVTLKPDFDDARYKLALLESNAGDYEAAVVQLRSMRNIAPARAYSYWAALAYALGELGRREQAKTAAEQAMQCATTAAERANASQLAYVAQTDLAVRFTRDASGALQLVTTRVPHGTKDFNPFIEPGDRIRRAEGQLQEVTCGGNQITGMTIQTAEASLRLAVADPLHVLIRNGPTEFMCGPQAAKTVTVDYAVSENGPSSNGVLRGMEFR